MTDFDAAVRRALIPPAEPEGITGAYLAKVGIAAVAGSFIAWQAAHALWFSLGIPPH